MNDIRKFLEEYEEYRALSRGVETVHSDRRELMKLFTWLILSGRSLEVSTIGRENIEAYLLEYSARRITAKTYRKALRAFRGFFEFLLERGIVGENPAKRIASVRRREVRPLGAYTEEEIERILERVSLSGFNPERERAIITLLYSVPIKRAELVDLDVADVGPGARTLTVRDGQSGKERTLSLGEKAASALFAYLLERQKTDTHEKALFCLDTVRHKARSGKRRITPAALFCRIHYWKKKAGVDAPGGGCGFRKVCEETVKERVAEEAAKHLSGRTEGARWNG